MATPAQYAQNAPVSGVDRAHRTVIFASSLGTVFEWYDFYLYGSLPAVISKQFFSGVNETTGYIFALLAFAAGFFVRPFGALLFGRCDTACRGSRLAPAAPSAPPSLADRPTAQPP